MPQNIQHTMKTFLIFVLLKCLLPTSSLPQVEYQQAHNVPMKNISSETDADENFDFIMQFLTIGSANKSETSISNDESPPISRPEPRWSMNIFWIYVLGYLILVISIVFCITIIKMHRKYMFR